MKNAEIEKLIKKNLKEFIEKYNFGFQQEILFLQPVDDMLLGFFFEKSSFNKDALYIWSFVQPLYIKSENITLSFGERLSYKSGELWHLKNNQNLESLIFELADKMTTYTISFFSKVNTSEKFYKYYEDKLTNVRMVQAACYSSIYSNHKDKSNILNNYILILENENLKINWLNNLLKEAKTLEIIINDEKSLNTFFKSNIHFTKSALKIE